MRIRVFKETDVRVPRRRLASLAGAIGRREMGGSGGRYVNLVLTTDRRIRSLNRQFRNHDAVTDVLSFNLDEGEESGGLLGEIYISVPAARRQAKEFGVSLSDELLRLACHGLLHLAGFDHRAPVGARRMKRLEEAYLKDVGME